MKKNFVFLSIMFVLLFCGCAIQQQTIPITQTSQTKPIVQEKKYIIPDNSLDSQLENLTKQIVNSMTEGGKRKVAVIEFSDLRGNVAEFGKYLSEELITRLFMTQRFEVIERRLLNKVLDEQKLSLSDLIDPYSIKELGKILGVDAIVSGTLTDLGTSLKVNARIISTETGSVFAVAATEIAKDATVKKLMRHIDVVQRPKEKVKKEEEKPFEKKVSEKGRIFFKEDFNEHNEGEPVVKYGYGLVVLNIGNRKCLTSQKKGTFPIKHEIAFPKNFIFEITVNDPANVPLIFIDSKGEEYMIDFGLRWWAGSNFSMNIKLPSDVIGKISFENRARIKIIKMNNVYKIYVNGSFVVSELNSKYADFIGFRYAISISRGGRYISSISEIVGTDLGD